MSVLNEALMLVFIVTAPLFVLFFVSLSYRKVETGDAREFLLLAATWLACLAPLPAYAAEGNWSGLALLAGATGIFAIAMLLALPPWPVRNMPATRAFRVLVAVGALAALPAPLGFMKFMAGYIYYGG